jgi:hypothetical protein
VNNFFSVKNGLCVSRIPFCRIASARIVCRISFRCVT